MDKSEDVLIVSERQPRGRAMAPLVRQKTISEEVVERIVLAIASGEQRPGARLTESSIAEVMDISRVPAREALLHLESIGILTGIGRRGLKIVDFSDRQARDLRDVRLVLEGLALHHALRIASRDPSCLDVLDDVLAELTKLSGTDDAIRLAECDVRFHREIIKMCDNGLLLRVWTSLEPHMIILMCRDWHYHRDKVGELNLHRELRDFVANGSPEDIERVLEGHIPKPKNEANGKDRRPAEVS